MSGQRHRRRVMKLMSNFTAGALAGAGSGETVDLRWAALAYPRAVRREVG